MSAPLRSPTSAAPRDDARVALLGYGLAGSVFHAPLVTTTPGLRLTHVVTANAERAAQARHDVPGVRIVPDADAVWAAAGRGEIDLVVVATPNRTHVPLARAALEAGCAVVVDKPFAPTAAEGRALIAEARRRGRMLTVFQNRRWDTGFLTARRLVAEGALGALWRWEARFERWRPTLTGRWRESAAPEEAGGTLFDLGPHLIDQALVLCGPVTHVYAEVDTRRAGAEVDDDAFVALTHRSGVRSHLRMGAAFAQPAPGLRALGSLAGYTKRGLDPQEEALRRGGRPTDAGWGEEPPERWGTLGAGDETTAVRSTPGCWQRFYEGVARSLREDAAPPVDPADSVAALEIIDAARRSSAAGRVVALTPDDETSPDERRP